MAAVEKGVGLHEKEALGVILVAQVKIPRTSRRRRVKAAIGTEPGQADTAPGVILVIRVRVSMRTEAFAVKRRRPVIP